MQANHRLTKQQRPNLGNQPCRSIVGTLHSCLIHRRKKCAEENGKKCMNEA